MEILQNTAAGVTLLEGKYIGRVQPRPAWKACSFVQAAELAQRLCSFCSLQQLFGFLGSDAGAHVDRYI